MCKPCDDEFSMIREEYLTQAVEEFRPLFAKQKYEIPPVLVSCGHPSKTPMKTLGECWSSECTTDGTRHIFISPRHTTTEATLGTLAHELLHAVLPDDAKHGPLFKEGMERIGLEPPARSAGPGKELQDFIDTIIEKLGKYPNVPLKPKEKKKKDIAQAKKSFKLFCPRKRNNEKSCILSDKTKDGDYAVTVSRKMLKLAFPICVCGVEMEMETEDFELYKLGDIE